MLLSTLALVGALAAAPLDFLHDPLLYPPEVWEDDPVEGGEIRATVGDSLAALVLEHSSVVAEVHAGLARSSL